MLLTEHSFVYTCLLDPVMPRNLGNCHGTWGILLCEQYFLNGCVVIATFLSILSVVPRHGALLTYFLLPKLKKNAVPITLS